jgi:protein-S-isoprenylcysteine O-methyltransferase Ste14
MIPELAISIVWVAWLASWIAAARWSDRTAKQPERGEQALYRGATLVGVILLFFGSGGGSRGFFQGRDRLWDVDQPIAWMLVAVVALGLAFTWWARIYLGRLWSSSVTRKVDHRIVDTGPYATVRHPIYTGLIVAIFATAALPGSLMAIVGALVMTLAFWIKARLEERFLREQLGPEAYDAYRRRTPMLLPFGPKSG